MGLENWGSDKLDFSQVVVFFYTVLFCFETMSSLDALSCVVTLQDICGLLVVSSADLETFFPVSESVLE